MRLQKAKQETQTKPRFQRAPPSQKKGAEAPPAPPPPTADPSFTQASGERDGEGGKAARRRAGAVSLLWVWQKPGKSGTHQQISETAAFPAHIEFLPAL